MRGRSSARAGRDRGMILAVLLALSGCPDPVSPPEPREIKIKPLFKPSCNSVCGSTCIACIDALEVFAVDEDGRSLLEPQWHDVQGRWETLCDLATSQSLVLLREVPAAEPMIVGLRAYRDRDAMTPDAGPDGGTLCLPPLRRAWSTERNTGDLMVWGRSRLTDLSADAGPTRIEIELECRAGCDCLDIGQSPDCPQTLRPSACLAGTSCAKPCTTDEECFEGALRCEVDAGTCNPEGPEGQTGRPFCASCQRRSDCEQGLCIAAEGSDTGFCAISCPNYPCPRGAKCTPVDQRSGYHELE